MMILLNIIFFILGFILRDILTYLYNINKKMKQAQEIFERERKRKRKRLEFKKKYDFSESFDDDNKD